MDLTLALHLGQFTQGPAGSGILGAPGFEQLQKLLAGAVIVPGAVALEEGDQSLCRLKALALGIEHYGQIIARLVVVRVGGNGRFERG